MIQPVNDYILISPVNDEKSAGGIILVSGEKAQRPDQGRILKVGPGKFVNGILEPMRLKEGQRILFTQFPFYEHTLNGKRVILVRELQVVAVIE
jgi:chaperonin GroES